MNDELYKRKMLSTMERIASALESLTRSDEWFTVRDAAGKLALNEKVEKKEDNG